MAPKAWAEETWRTYVGNATSVRDFRVQMRGSKTILAWSLYLAVLLLVAYGYYTSVYGNSNGIASAATLQRLLQSSFVAILNTLAILIALIAPGLTAASIAGERQRRSFDLVFSAPVTPKYFLVGKMLASYRYTIMLLVLSIPVLALTAMMGGATWGDIITCYLMLSLNALVLTSIALLVSSMVERVQAAVALSYLLCGLYIGAMSIIGWASGFWFSGTPYFANNGPVGEAPFLTTLSLFTVYQFYGTFTPIWGLEVPNWILNALFTLALVRLALLGAGSALSNYGAPETKSLRIQALLYLFALTLLLVFFPVVSSRRTLGGFLVTFIFLLLVTFVPWIAGWGESSRRITSHDGAWKWKRAFFGTPSGAGPYLVLMAVAVIAGSLFVSRIRGVDPVSYLAHIVQGIGVLVFFAGFTRWLCGRCGYARGMVLANLSIIFALWILPIFVSIAVFSNWRYSVPVEQRTEWLVWPMWPIAADLSYSALLGYGAAAALVGELFWIAAERIATEVRQVPGTPRPIRFET